MTIMMAPAKYESRKTFDEGVMKFVVFGQQQEIYVVGTLVTKL